MYNKIIQTRTRGEIVLLGIFSLALSVGIFFLAISLFPFTLNLPETSGTGANIKEIRWEILEGITSLVTLSLFIGGIVFAFSEHYQNAMDRKWKSSEASLNIYKELYDRLMNPQAVTARRWVILNLPTLEEVGNDRELWLREVNRQLNKIPRGWKGARPPGKEYVKEILNSLDFIGFATKHYWNIQDELVGWMSPSVAKIWERLEVYVEEEANQRNEPDYYASAREFGRYCIEWREKHNYPKSTVIKNAT